MIAVHGRTREQGYRGHAEYDTVAAVKAAVRVPVVANGDIDTPWRAREVLQRTGVDALMIGRAAQGRPWIFREIAQFLDSGTVPPPPATHDVARWLLEHLDDHHALYGPEAGVRSARKHIGWALCGLPGGASLRARLNALDDARAQRAALSDYFEHLADAHILLPLPACPPDVDHHGGSSRAATASGPAVRGCDLHAAHARPVPAYGVSAP